jgi:hypothetical protein
MQLDEKKMKKMNFFVEKLHQLGAIYLVVEKSGKIH